MDALVVGAGVVGLAVARALSRRGVSVIVAEAADAVGTGVSARSSEVLHGGMYYPPGSHRARYCVDGRRRLTDFCESHGVPYRLCGKLIVATCEVERSALEAIHARGVENGVEDLVWLERADTLALEPALSCVAALHSPATGVIDSHALMLALLGDIEAAGGVLALRTPIESARWRDGRWQVRFGGPAPDTLGVDLLVNAAGLGAQALAGRIEGVAPAWVPRQVLAKGSYFGCTGRPAFSRLIYPVPVEGGLGIHLTLDLAGRMRFGPDVEWVDTLDYTVDPGRSDRFEAAIRSYWPGLEGGRLTPNYAGIRPKLSGPGEPSQDFRIDGPSRHGMPGLAQLFGIESPGLTSCLSLAEAVADELGA